jgi:hypothetical protein
MARPSHPPRENCIKLSLFCTFTIITELRRQQAEVIQNNGNANVCNIRQGEVQHRKHKKLKVGGDQAYGRSSV